MKQLLLSLTMFFATASAIAQDQPVPPPPPVVEQPTEVFAVVEQMPRFPGCEDLNGTSSEKQQCAQQKMIEYVYANLKYPESAVKDSLEGRVITQFVVGTDGTLKDIKAVRGDHESLNAEAVRVVESMNHMEKKWTPGMHKGKAVAVSFMLPVSFKIAK